MTRCGRATAHGPCQRQRRRAGTGCGITHDEHTPTAAASRRGTAAATAATDPLRTPPSGPVRIADLPDVLYHGTSRGNADTIAAEGGMRAPVYLTDDPDLAWYYAECADDEDGTGMVVLTVHTAGLTAELVELDSNALAEPVGPGRTEAEMREAAEKAWDQLVQVWPDAAWSDPSIQSRWDLSLVSVNSVRYSGPVPVALLLED